MKTTKYFMTKTGHNQPEIGFDSVIKQKNDFLKQNSDNIGKIDDEDIKITSIPGNQILFIIQLTYYPTK